MNNRNTKQKQVILNVLDKNRIHPTIKEVQEMVKMEDPNIGQATIYRNINRLVDEKKVTKIPTTEGIDHYDINVNPHYHFLCKRCKKVYDIFDDNYLSFINIIKEKYQVEIEHSNIVFEGICKECLSEEV